jgi:hypothetical protein
MARYFWNSKTAIWTQTYQLRLKNFLNRKVFKTLTKLKKTTWLIEIQKYKTTISITAENFLKQKSFQNQRRRLDWLNARQPYQLRLKKFLKSFSKKMARLIIKRNARQHNNGKKTIMAINTIVSSFLKI